MGCCGDTNTLKLKVEGMSCGHCKMAVEKAVGGVDGVTGVAVDLGSKQVTISGRFDKDSVVKAIEDAGYDVVG
jgi:copper chaperone